MGFLSLFQKKFVKRLASHIGTFTLLIPSLAFAAVVTSLPLTVKVIPPMSLPVGTPETPTGTISQLGVLKHDGTVTPEQISMLLPVTGTLDKTLKALFGSQSKRHEGDVIVEASPFNTDVVFPGANYRTLVPVIYTPTLKSTSVAKNKGKQISGITDGFSGNAPDMGAVISGRALPVYGDRRK